MLPFSCCARLLVTNGITPAESLFAPCRRFLLAPDHFPPPGQQSCRHSTLPRPSWCYMYAPCAPSVRMPVPLPRRPLARRRISQYVIWSCGMAPLPWRCVVGCLPNWSTVRPVSCYLREPASLCVASELYFVHPAGNHDGFKPLASGSGANSCAHFVVCDRWSCTA